MGDQGLYILEQQLRARYPTAANVHITHVKSGFLQGGFVPSAKHVQNRTGVIIPPDSVPVLPQRVIACAQFGSAQRAIYSDVLVEGTTGLWVARVRALLRCQPIVNGETGEEEEIAFVQYYEYTTPCDRGERVLKAVTLRWSTDDEQDHTVNTVRYTTGAMLPAPWYGLEPAEAIRGVVHVLRTNYERPGNDQQLHWFQHRFCINPYYVPRMHRSGIPDVYA